MTTETADNTTSETGAAGPIRVQIHEAQPNPIFSEEQRAWIRFLEYDRPVPCAECGKLATVHWTMLCEFRAASPAAFVMRPGERRHMPLTPVCEDHLLAPAIDEPPALDEPNPGDPT